MSLQTLVNVPDLEVIPRIPDDLAIIETDNERVRLGPIRARLAQDRVDGAFLLNYVRRVYYEWVNQSEYLVFGQYDPLEGYEKFRASKASKRGNDVYHKRVKERFQEVMDLPDTYFFSYKDRGKRHKTRAIFVTLTYDQKNKSIAEGWETVGEDYNRFITAIRKRYGTASVLRVFEAQGNGHPHIHAIVIFKEHEMNAFHHNGVWRVQEKREIEKYWSHGFSDVEALSSTKGGFHYVAKYLGKMHELGHVPNPQEGPKHEHTADNSPVGVMLANTSLTTLALMWVFRKRAFSISGDLVEYIREMHNSNEGIEYFQLLQVDLEGGASAESLNRWVLLGFWGGVLKKGRKKPWSVDLTYKEFSEMKGSGSWSDNRYLV